MLLIYSTGLAGLINTIQMYTRPAIVAAILGTVSTVGFILQGVGLAYFYHQVRTLAALHRVLVMPDVATRFGPTIMPRDTR
jgi:hypothetical protein